MCSPLQGYKYIQGRFSLGRRGCRTSPAVTHLSRGSLSHHCLQVWHTSTVELPQLPMSRPASHAHCFINYFNDNLLLRLLIKLLREEENHIASKSELLLHGAIRKVLLKYLHSSTPVVKQRRFPVSVKLCLEPGDRPSCPRVIWRLAAMVKKRISPFRVLPFISDCG